MAQEARGRTVTAAVAAELRAIMARRQMKGVQLAEATGLPKSTMAGLLAGTSAMDLDQLMKICTVLDLEPGELNARGMTEAAAHSDLVTGAKELTERQRKELARQIESTLSGDDDNP